jgi:transglycosylase-like protein with SLT domain/uncharacterized protein DUF4124
MADMDRGYGGFEPRQGDRRQAERRQSVRAGCDRRQGDRRAAAGAVFLTLAALAVVPEARADIYTRTNESGVTEATNLPSAKDFKLTYRSKGVVIHSPGFTLRPSANRDFDDHIQAAAGSHGISEELIRAIIQVESQFDRLAVSTAGARGLMQLMPATARSMGVTDSFDARQNIFGGARYLKQLLRLYGGDVSLAAAAYNAGEGAVARYNGIPPYKETQGYVRKVNAILGSVMTAVAAEIPAMFIAAGEGARMNPPPAPRTVGGRIMAIATRSKSVATKPTPRVYYRWKDAKGVMHMSEAPPATGEYKAIKSTD